jgi:hypothetical protein
MPGARLIHPSPESRRPLARADPQAATDCSPAYDSSPWNVSGAAAPRIPLLTRISPQPPAPERRRGLSSDSPDSGTPSRPLAVASTHLPARRRAFSPGRDDICPPTAPTRCRVTAECTDSAQSTAGQAYSVVTPVEDRPQSSPDLRSRVGTSRVLVTTEWGRGRIQSAWRLAAIGRRPGRRGITQLNPSPTILRLFAASSPKPGRLPDGHSPSAHTDHRPAVFQPSGPVRRVVRRRAGGMLRVGGAGRNGRKDIPRRVS